MSTDLEKYLREQRNRLDVESPDDLSIWEGIRNRQGKKNTSSKRTPGKTVIMRLRNIAAITLIALLAGYVINDITGDINPGREIALSAINGELAQKEKDYRKLIRYKKQEIGSFRTTGNIIINELIEELGRLDEIYSTLTSDLNTMGYNEKIINAIFDTYEKKVHILELIILETNKTEKNENRENISL